MGMTVLTNSGIYIDNTYMTFSFVYYKPPPRTLSHFSSFGGCVARHVVAAVAEMVFVFHYYYDNQVLYYMTTSSLRLNTISVVRSTIR